MQVQSEQLYIVNDVKHEQLWSLQQQQDTPRAPELLFEKGHKTEQNSTWIDD